MIAWIIRFTLDKWFETTFLPIVDNSVTGKKIFWNNYQENKVQIAWPVVLFFCFEKWNIQDLIVFKPHRCGGCNLRPSGVFPKIETSQKINFLNASIFGHGTIIKTIFLKDLSRTQVPVHKGCAYRNEATWRRFWCKRKWKVGRFATVRVPERFLLSVRTNSITVTIF